MPCATLCWQILGGNGYINDYPTGRLLRDAKVRKGLGWARAGLGVGHQCTGLCTVFACLHCTRTEVWALCRKRGRRWMAHASFNLDGSGALTLFCSRHAVQLYEIGAGTSEIRRYLIGRELFKECVEGRLQYN